MDVTLWLRLLHSVSLADHTGDVADDMREYAKKAGLPFPDDDCDFDDWRMWLKKYGCECGIWGG